MQIDILIAEPHLDCNLLGAPLKPKELRQIWQDLWDQSIGITANAAAVSAHQYEDLADGLIGFQDNMNW
jgi:hypothetical protein